MWLANHWEKNNAPFFVVRPSFWRKFHRSIQADFTLTMLMCHQLKPIIIFIVVTITVYGMKSKKSSEAIRITYTKSLTNPFRTNYI